MLFEGDVLFKPEPDRHLLSALMERIVPLDNPGEVVRQKLLDPEDEKVLEGTFLSGEMKPSPCLLNQPEVIRMGIRIMGIHPLLRMGPHGKGPVLPDQKAQGNLPGILQVDGANLPACLLRPKRNSEAAQPHDDPELHSDSY